MPLMGQFETKFDPTFHENILECLRYLQFIGQEDNDKYLEEYTKPLIWRFIEDQVQYLPKNKRVN